jgi:hypothetical protein
MRRCWSWRRTCSTRCSAFRASTQVGALCPAYHGCAVPCSGDRDLPPAVAPRPGPLPCIAGRIAQPPRTPRSAPLPRSRRAPAHRRCHPQRRPVQLLREASAAPHPRHGGPGHRPARHREAAGAAQAAGAGLGCAARSLADPWPQLRHPASGMRPPLHALQPPAPALCQHRAWCSEPPTPAVGHAPPQNRRCSPCRSCAQPHQALTAVWQLPCPTRPGAPPRCTAGLAVQPLLRHVQRGFWLARHAERPAGGAAPGGLHSGPLRARLVREPGGAGGGGRAAQG